MYTLFTILLFCVWLKSVDYYYFFDFTKFRVGRIRRTTNQVAFALSHQFYGMEHLSQIYVRKLPYSTHFLLINVLQLIIVAHCPHLNIKLIAKLKMSHSLNRKLCLLFVP